MAELIRGKVGRVYGDLMQLLTVMKGTPLAYNKDFQEDKESLFDAIDTWKATIDILQRCWTRPNSGWIRSKNSLEKAS